MSTDYQSVAEMTRNGKKKKKKKSKIRDWITQTSDTRCVDHVRGENALLRWVDFALDVS